MRTAIIVLGMHRSGTSALTWLLGQAGAELPRDPLPPQRDNPAGFWESAGLVAANDRFLKERQSSWYDPRPFQWQLLRENMLEQCKASIRKSIEEGWPTAPLLAIKDPRICRFVPLMTEILCEMGIGCRALLALRSPDSVVASLSAREGMGANYGRLLWLRHMLEAELATRDMPRIVLSYDAVLENWRSAIEPLSKIVGQSWSPSAQQISAIDEYLQPQLRHHKPGDSPGGGGLLPPTVESIWQGLIALSQRDDGDACRELDLAYRKFEKRPYIESDAIFSELRRLRGRALTAAPTIASTGPGLRIHIVARLGDRGPQSSAYIRLLQPLSEDVVKDRIHVSLDSWEGPLPTCDICIVQRAAVPDLSAARQLITVLGERGVPLIVDLDDGFTVMSSEQVEAGGYAPRNAALELLLDASAEVWFATQPLADCYPAVRDRTVVVENSIDTGLWCNWPQRRSGPATEARTRLLYMGTGTHAEDFALVRPSLEHIWETKLGKFDLTLIGVADEVDPAPWLTHMQPPPDCTPYPKFVNWLREQGPFDVGIAPLADTPFNRVKSDIKLLDYSAMGLRALVSDLPAYRADSAFQSSIVTDWFEGLSDVIDNPDYARVQAQTAVAHIFFNRTTRRTAIVLLDRIEALVTRSKRQRPRV